MRRPLFIFSAVLALAVSAGFAGVPAAHAQTAQTTCPVGCEYGTIGQRNGCVLSSDKTQICPTLPGAGGNAALTAQNAQGNPSANTPMDFGSSSLNDAIAYMFSLLMTLFAWLLGVAMVVLDGTVYYTVVTMGNYINNLSAIGVAWRIFRDIGNIALIFGFLAIGITTIMDVEWYGGRFKMLPMLLVAAVFLNFSLFMTEAVIDAGNLFATQFYTQINGGIPAGSKFASTGVLHETISNKIMSQLGLQTLYGDALTDSGLFKAGNTTLIGLLGILLFIVAAFVMFSLSFILIARFVYLIYLIIISPLGFAGFAIPQLEATSKRWMHDLFDQTLTAPILLLLLYIALAVITDVNFISGFGAPPDYAGFIPNGDTRFDLPGFVSMLLTFLVAMGLLLLVTIQAKKLSAFGGEWAMKTAGKLSFGLTAAGMRGTGGWAMQRASQGWRKMGLSRAPVVGRAVSGLLDRGAKASFDVRGATIAGGLKALKVEAGDAQKGGFRKWEEERIKEREKYAKSLEQTTGTFWGIGEAQRGEEQKQRDAEEDKKKLEGALKDTEGRHKDEMQTLLEAQKKDLQGYEDEIRNAQLNLAKMEGDLRKGKKVPESDLAAAASSVQKARQARDNKLSEQRAQQKNLKETQKAQPETILETIVNTINPKRNTEAAKNIVKFAAKSKSEKDSDKLFDLLEKATKKEEEGKEKEKKEKKEEGGEK
ncbi:MAG: hypothetical protein KGH56_01420 [Patescibacteria group bacterium]|nr:hypothetical protein [Patescibacteria group bacterium]